MTSKSVFTDEYEQMIDASETLKAGFEAKRDSISYDVACTLRGRIGHLLKAIGDYAADGIAGEYRANDIEWQNVQGEALALREMMDYV